MTKKQAEGLVKGVKDPELLAAWKKKLAGELGASVEDTTDKVPVFRRGLG